MEIREGEVGMAKGRVGKDDHEEICNDDPAGGGGIRGDLCRACGCEGR
jgi:hypothetical protein